MVCVHSSSVYDLLLPSVCPTDGGRSKLQLTLLMLCLPQAMRYPPKAYRKDFESVEVCCVHTCICVCE